MLQTVFRCLGGPDGTCIELDRKDILEEVGDSELVRESDSEAAAKTLSSRTKREH